MRKIFIDHQTFSLQKYGGISRYFANIYQNTLQKPDITSELGILYTRNYYLKDYPAVFNRTVGEFLFKKERKYYKWNNKYSAYLIKKNNHDILHPSYYNPYFLKYNKKPVVITVHDMIHERFPEYFNQSEITARNKRLCIENANHIIAISDATKKDLIDIYQVSEDRITVLHHGYQISSDGYHSASVTTQANAGRYLLYIGDRSGYKNFSFFLQAVSGFLREDPTLKLICAGGGGFQVAEEETISRLKISKQVKQISATDKELSELYQKATAFIFPSLYEGFGLPILEAFQNSCPVIASSNACFHEIGENAIAYFNPQDLHSISETIKEVMNNPLLREKLIASGRDQLLKFSMESCMNKTIAVYNHI